MQIYHQPTQFYFSRLVTSFLLQDRLSGSKKIFSFMFLLQMQFSFIELKISSFQITNIISVFVSFCVVLILQLLYFWLITVLFLVFALIHEILEPFISFRFSNLLFLAFLIFVHQWYCLFLIYFFRLFRFPLWHRRGDPEKFSAQP